jgi:hypothetical protein
MGYNNKMRFFRVTSLLFICFSLLVGGMANTAMPCCMKQSGAAMIHKDAMPCHKDSSKKEAKSHFSCEKCRTCLGTSAIITPNTHHSIAFTAVTHQKSATGFTSHDPGELYSPPESISA